MEPVLGYIEDNIAGENVAAVPSREQLHNDAALEISPLASLASRTTDQGVVYILSPIGPITMLHTSRQCLCKPIWVREWIWFLRNNCK